MDKELERKILELGKHKRFHIPMFRGRPDRITPISADDITNLKIDLGLCYDIQDLYTDHILTTAPKIPDKFRRENVYDRS
jgi:hypothetical protein